MRKRYEGGEKGGMLLNIPFQSATVFENQSQSFAPEILAGANI
jgi:hypothetical protein